MTNGTTTVTSATGGFTALMLGNGIRVVNDNVYEIRVINSSNSITVDRATGNGGAGQTGNVGGAGSVSTRGFDPEADAVLQPSHKIWVRSTNSSGAAASYSPSSCSLSASGGPDQAITTEGYATVRGDGGQATILFSGGLTVGGLYRLTRNLIISGATTNGINNTGGGSFFENITIIPASGAFGISSSAVQTIFRRCWVQKIPGNNGQSLQAGGNGCLYEYCRFDGTSAGADNVAISSVGGPSVFRNCIFRNAAGNGVRTNNSSFSAEFHNCIFWNNAGAGLQLTQGAYKLTGSLVVENCIFGQNGTYDIDFTVEDATAFPGALEFMKSVFPCNWFLTTGTARYHQLPANPNDHSLTVDPFVASATGNFNLNSLPGGGAAITAAPCAIPFADGVNTANILAGPFGVVPATSALVNMRSLWREYSNERIMQNGSGVQDAVVDLYLQAGLEWLNRICHYHVSTDTTALTLVAGQQEYSVPTDHVEALWVRWRLLDMQRGDVERWRADDLAWAQEPAGEPREWALYADKIILRPTPSAEAVAASSTCTLRYVSTPGNITTNGPEQLGSENWRTVVLYAVALWVALYPDTALSQSRFESLMKECTEQAQLIAAEYAKRSIGR